MLTGLELLEIASVQVDIYKKEREFNSVNLSDENVIRWMILFRDKVDPYLGEKVDRYYNNAGNVKELNQELIAMYATLDTLIAKCDFNAKQKSLIKLLSLGYTFRDVSEITGTSSSQKYKDQFKTICKTIVNMNKYLWKIYVHKKYLNTEMKTCSKCADVLPKTKNFFSPDKFRKDSFFPYCRKCNIAQVKKRYSYNKL